MKYLAQAHAVWLTAWELKSVELSGVSYAGGWQWQGQRERAKGGATGAGGTAGVGKGQGLANSFLQPPENHRVSQEL